MNKKHHSGVFMMEMIAVVFFFILCASVCTLVYAKADKMSKRASDTNESVLMAQSVAEIWKAKGPEEVMRRQSARELDGTYYICWTKDWEPIPQETEMPATLTEYYGTMEITKQEKYENAVITIENHDREELFTLEVSRHDLALEGEE